MTRPLALCVALSCLVAASVAEAAVTGSFSVDGVPIAITDVSAEHLEADGPDDPAWSLVFTEKPHEHTAAGRSTAHDGSHGLAFRVEILVNGEGHNFVFYEPSEDGSAASPHSFPWPAVSSFVADGETVRGILRNNPDFPYEQIVFDLDFDAPVVAP